MEGWERFAVRWKSLGVWSGMIPSTLLLEAYAQGIFPMAMRNGEIGWFSPDPRGILPIHGFHVPHGLRRALRKHHFEIRIDTAFEAVMEGCASRGETWISREIIESYVALHQAGFAHAVECWIDGRLAGGLYGVALGGAFFGESMFHAETDASKLALHALVERLREREFTLLDTQWVTPHLMQFGAIEIPRRRYLNLLKSSLRRHCAFA
jgi:leucyl/phenylalanyl-tRNA--protein transferase